MKKRIEAIQNGKVVMYDVEDFAREYGIEIGKMKKIIREVLWNYGYMEFKEVVEQ